MIEKSEGKNGNIIYMYKQPDISVQKDFFDMIISSVADYADLNDIDQNKIQFNFKLINEIFIRVDKRKDYYIIFHHETYLNEVREAALIAFWILKFKPFSMTSENGNDYNLNINCGFAAYIIFCAVSEYANITYNGNKEFFVTEEYIEKIMYALKYWDLSKEALMLVAETLCGSIKDTDNDGGTKEEK